MLGESVVLIRLPKCIVFLVTDGKQKELIADSDV